MTSHAKFNRNFVRAGLLAAALSYVPLSHAFTTLNPPLGWTPGGGPGGSMAGPAALSGGASYSGGAYSTSGGLSAGGRVTSIPATARLAAGAGRVAAAALFRNPYIATGLAVAGWLASSGYLWKPDDGGWVDPRGNPQNEPSTGLEFSTGYLGGQWFPSASQACSAGAAQWASNANIALQSTSVETNGSVYFCIATINNSRQDMGQISTRNGSCPFGWYVTPAGCVQNPPPRVLTESDFVDGVTETPMPQSVPPEIPVPLPVQLPSVQPTFVPTGNPFKNPDFNPNAAPSTENQPFLQPGVRVTPAPTTDNPWQVDVVPVNRPVATGDPNTNAIPETGTETGDKPKEGDPQSICEKHPDILACAKVPEADTPDGDIPKKTENIALEQTEYFGSGSCPADSYRNIHGQSLKVWDWRKTCDFAGSYVQPVFLVAGAFAALMIVLGGTKSS